MELGICILTKVYRILCFLFLLVPGDGAHLMSYVALLNFDFTEFLLPLSQKGICIWVIVVKICTCLL